MAADGEECLTQKMRLKYQWWSTPPRDSFISIIVCEGQTYCNYFVLFLLYSCNNDDD